MDRQIEAITTLRAPLEMTREIFSGSPGRVFADPGTMPKSTPRTFLTTLSAHFGDNAAVEQEVAVQLGAVDRSAADVVLPISWEPSSHERVFPSFAGTLTLSSPRAGGTLLTLTGTYRIPMGPVGRFGDVVVGRRLARQSLDAFVQRLASCLDAEADRRRRTSIKSPKPYNVDLREFGALER